MIRKCIGIDVGLSSAAAACYGYEGRSNLPRLLSVYDLPTVGEDGGKRIDVAAFHRWLGEQDAEIAYVENATAMPSIPDASGKRRGMGAGTMARYLRACGAIETCVTLSGMETVLVMPTTWKRALNLLKADKKASLNLAREFFPDYAITTFKLQKNHNRAEASLIALYGAVRCDIVDIVTKRGCDYAYDCIKS